MMNAALFKKVICTILGISLLPVFSGCGNVMLNADSKVELQITEVVTSNSRCLVDEELGTPDWIELYNASASPIQLSGYGLSDDIRDPHRWTFPDVTIGAGEYLIVYATKASSDNSSKLTTGFGLSKGGEAVHLTDRYFVVLDQVDVPTLETDIAYARAEDGAWGYCASPTPGKANTEDIVNSLSELIYASGRDALVISEVMPRNAVTLPDKDGNYSGWAELYNNTAEPIMLSAYYLSDDMNAPQKYHLPGVMLESGGYIVIFLSGDESDGDELHAPFRLSKTDGSLVLSDMDGNVCSHISWETPIQNDVCVVAPNTYCAYPTPGAANPDSTFSETEFTAMGENEPVRLSEVLVRNKYSIVDEDGDREPFAELHNVSDSAVSLAGYYLSDDVDEPLKWALPGIELDAGGYAVVFLSGKDRRDPSAQLHTSFRLSRNDGALVFTNMHGLKSDSFAFGADIGDNISIGTAADGSFKYFATPTPGAANTAHGFEKLSDVSVASADSVYISEVSAAQEAKSGRSDWIELYNGSGSSISLTGWHLTDDPDDFTKFTIPDMKIASGGHAVIYASSGAAEQEGVTAPFGISASGETLILTDESGEIKDIFETGALRVGVSSGRAEGDASFKRLFYSTVTKGEANPSGGFAAYVMTPVLSDNTLYHSNSFKLEITCATEGADIYYTTDCSAPTASSARYTGPISVSGNTTVRAVGIKNGLVSSETVTATYLFEKQHTLPVVCVTMDEEDRHDVYSVTDRWKKVERGGYFEFYEPDGRLGIGTGCGYRVAGASTLTGHQKSLSIAFRAAYGMAGISYPFYEESDVGVYKSLVIRNSGQDRGNTRMKDSVLSWVVKGMNMEYIETRPVIVYLNGSYWGIYDLNENQNEDYVANHYGVNADNVEIVRRNTTALEGTNVEFKRVRAYALSEDLSDQAVYDKFLEWVDVDYFIDYLATQVYFTNSDMFNQKYWRSMDYTVKWRPIYFDLDYSMHNCDPGRNILPSYFRYEGVQTPDGSFTNMDIYVGLKKNPQWCEKFAERYVYLIYNFFTPERVNAKIDAMAALLEPEMARHLAKWDDISSVSAWKRSVSDFKDCVNKRPEYALRQLQSYFEISDAKMQEYIDKAKSTAPAA